MKCNNIKRRLKTGDSIECNGKQVTICEILYQDYHKDVNAKEYNLPDRSYIDIEFTDEKGEYHLWISNINGGKIIYNDEVRPSECFEEFEKLFHNTGRELQDVVKVLKIKGYEDELIYKSILNVLKHITWED